MQTKTHEYEVLQNIPEIGARVYDVLIWRHPEVFLCRKRNGEVLHWKYPAHYSYAFLAYEDAMRPLQPDAPPVREILSRAVGDSLTPHPVSSSRHLRLVR